MIARLLIANRGEIACRIIDTCKRMGVETVAVYSDADRDALHTRRADMAIHIGAAPASESYLNVAALLDAAQASGADAIHPGYGFLSENAGFARACTDAGLIFVGPDPETIERMGNKDEAKAIMEAAGVPVVPGYHGDNQDAGFLQKQAGQIGYPLMIKAVAGGGGKGMRIVRDDAGFADALAGARREAMSSFSDDRVLLERYLTNPRHVEVQVFADKQGNTVHLFERECSVQRRYQKVIEESPCPVIDDTTREKMTDAAVAAACAVDYRNAGTVEFIVDEDGDFYFMEMNTRLQVEHPVTEMATGLDLVEWQLRVASGEPLPLSQEQIVSNGHAIEVRLYAENPFNGFLPATGTIEGFSLPWKEEYRLDRGIKDQDVVSVYYDPMLAKLIVHGETREQARLKLISVLEDTALFGVANNLPLLRAITRSRAFADAVIHTGYLDAHLANFLDDCKASEEMLIVAAVKAFHYRLDDSAFTAGVDQLESGSPWHDADYWRLGGQTSFACRFAEPDGTTHDLEVKMATAGHRGECFCVTIDGRERAITHTGQEIWQFDGEPVSTSASGQGDWLLVEVDGRALELRKLNPYYSGKTAADDDAHPGSPLPGKIVSMLVAEGDEVDEGDKLLVLEGMKMEYTLVAKTSGVVDKLLHQVGDIVEAEVPLVDIRPHEDAA